MSSGETFTVDLKSFIDKAKAAPDKVLRSVSQQLLTSTVLRTPVGNPDLWKSKPPKGYVGGRLRANWNASLVAPDYSTTDAIDVDGSSTISRGNEAIGQAKGETAVFLMNSLPYALPIEYGHSGAQAPEGMVRITVQEFSQYIDKAIAELDQ